jgi:hypothetical protein
MSRKAAQSPKDSGPVQLSSMLGLKTRLTHLGLLDWVGILIVIVGIALALYLQTLRHP